MKKVKIRIGTRGSQLAKCQADMVRAELCRQAGFEKGEIKIVSIKTAGDKSQKTPISEKGLKGVFTKELEIALLKNKIDIAVHSAKDMAAKLPSGLVLAAVLKRGDVRDALVTKNKKINSINGLPKGAVVGTSSVRRRAILASIRSDIKFVGLRGNVPTRIKKIKGKMGTKIHSTILAAAGLERLGLERLGLKRLGLKRLGIESYQPLPTSQFLPAPCQGAIAIQIRKDDVTAKKIVKKINCKKTLLEITAERAFLKQLGGNCQTPISALASFYGGKINFKAQVLSIDGKQKYKFKGSCKPNQASTKNLGKQAGKHILQKTGKSFFKQFAK